MQAHFNVDYRPSYTHTQFNSLMRCRISVLENNDWLFAHLLEFVCMSLYQVAGTTSQAVSLIYFGPSTDCWKRTLSWKIHEYKALNSRADW